MPTTLYEKVLAVFGMLRNSIDQKTGKIDLAPLFNASVGYPVDSLVVYENVLYRCTTAHQGNWNAADFATATIQDILALKAKKSDLAPEYNEETMYLKYQLVFKDGEFSQCIVPGVGSDALFQRITVSDLIYRIEQEITQGIALDAIYAAVQNIAPAYTIWQNYKVKNICTYKGVLYECIEDVSSEVDDPDESWWNRYWKRTTVDAVLKSQYIQNGSELETLVFNNGSRKLEITADAIIVSPLTGGLEYQERIKLNVSKSGTVSLLQDLAPNYEDLTKDGEVEFEAGRIVTYLNGLYLCNETHTSQLWQEGKWTECTIDAVIDALIASLADVRADVASLEDQVLVGRDGTAVGVSTTGLLPSYGGMDFVRRIFFVPSQMSVPDIVGLSVLNGKSELDNGTYGAVWFKPAVFGWEEGGTITSVSFVTRNNNMTDVTVRARISKYTEGSGRTHLGFSTNLANWSAQAAVIEYTFDGILVDDPNAFFCITFAEENVDNFVNVGLRVLRQVGKSNSPIFHVNNLIFPSSQSNVTPYNMTVNGDGVANHLYHMHICECDEGFAIDNIGPNVAGKVVASMTPDQAWPPFNSATSCRYVLSEAFHFENPDRVHFIAFDTEAHVVGDIFSTGKFLPIGLVRNSSHEYTCPTAAFLLSTDDHACPRVSFIRAITPYRRKMTYCYDSADFSNAPRISLPSTASGEVESRILVYGCGELSTLDIDSETGLHALIGGDSSWLNNNNGVYSIDIEAYTTIMLVFKSIGTVVRPLANTANLSPINLWSVERLVLN